MRKNGRTLRDDIGLIKRGIKEFGVFLPGQFRTLFFHSVVTILIPYIGILMTSLIISELSLQKRTWLLLSYVAAAIVLTLVMTVISAFLGKRLNTGYNQLFPAHEIRLNEKANSMKYSLIEDPDTRKLRDEVSGSIDCSGAGMGSLYWDCGSIFKALVSALVSIVILCANIRIGSISFRLDGTLLGAADSIWGYLILTILIIVSAYISSKMTSRIFDVSFDVFKNGAKYNRYADYYKLEYLSNDKSAQDVRIYSQKDLILSEIMDKCYIPFSKGDKREKDTGSRTNGVKLLLSAITGGAVYILVGAGAMNGKLGIGSVLLVYSAVTLLIKALTDIAMTFTDLRNNNEHLVRYFDYVSVEEEKVSDADASSEGRADIKIENVSFRYPGSENFALKDISLDIGNGEKIAIVGMNGSGKTTLVKLICGLYDVTSGTIRINGKVVDADNRTKTCGCQSVVFQDFSLLSLPIGKNIASGNTYDEKRVWDALMKVGMAGKVRTYPMGLSQSLYKDYDEDGTDLSGGEAQKIAIARGIYKDSSLVILDELTAALDPFAEYEIFTKMNEISRDKTTIFISHRLYSCKFCDRVIVLDKGEVVQQGSHEELVKTEGQYKKMWDAQAEYYIM